MCESEKNLCAVEIFVYYLSRKSVDGGRVECCTRLTPDCSRLPTSDMAKTIGKNRGNLIFPIAMSFSIRNCPETLLVYFGQLYLTFPLVLNLTVLVCNRSSALINSWDNSARYSSTIFFPIFTVLEMALVVIPSLPVN